MSNALRAAQEASPKTSKEETTVQESIVWLKGSQVKRTQADRVDAQRRAAALTDRPTDPPSVRPSVCRQKSPELQGSSDSHNCTDTTKTETDSRKQGSYFQAPCDRKQGQQIQPAAADSREEEETVGGDAWARRVAQNTG